MRIGIDIDGVLTEREQFQFDYGTKYCFDNNINYNINPNEYNTDGIFNFNKEQDNDFWDKHIWLYAENVKARPFSTEVIKQLKDDGHEIYIITARWLSNRNDDIGIRMKDSVKKWLYDNKIVYDKLIFSVDDEEKKAKEMRENKIDLMIEDSPKNINELSNIVKVICFNTPYNGQCLGSNIIRCYSWNDIYNKIFELKEMIS